MATSVNVRVDDPTAAGVDHYVGLEHLDSDSLKIRRWGSPADVTATKLLFEPGDIIFARRRAYQRKLGVAEWRGIASAHSLVLRANPDVVLPEFLPFFMQSDLFMDLAQKISVGSLSPTINWKTLAKQEFALPPLLEQERILRLLGSISGAIEAHAQCGLAAVKLKRSMQKRFFIERPDGLKLKIRDVAQVRNGTTPRRSNARYWGGDIPWLPTGKVNDGRIMVADEGITAAALGETSLSMIPAGSTLVAMIGEGQTRGRSAYLGIDATINQNFAAVIPAPSIDAEFLYYQLDARYEDLRRWSHGTNQHALNCRLVSEFPVFIPGRHRQDEIRTVIAAADREIGALEQRKQHAQGLLKNWYAVLLG